MGVALTQLGQALETVTLLMPKGSEYSGDYNELVYLRARFYTPKMGRFLSRDMWMGDYNKPLSLNRWAYVYGNPINYTDPTGLCGKPGEPPCPDWWLNQTQIYMEGLGYFDSEHLDRGWRHAAFFIQQIEAALNLETEVKLILRRNHRGMLPLARAESQPSYWVDYVVSDSIKDDQIYGVAYGMLIDFERGYEEYQSSKVFPFNLSGFAPADLPSDHLGFWAYMNGYERDEIPTLLECLGEVEILFPQLLGVVMNTAVNRRGDGSIIGIAQNREFLPMVRETIDTGTAIINRTENIAWPSSLEIQPIHSGPNTWQVWNRSH